MLAPRFTIRTLLIVLTAGAVVFLVAGMAVRGQMWAWGVTIAAASLVVTILIHGVWFSIVWLFSLLLLPKGPAASAPGNEPKRPPAR